MSSELYVYRNNQQEGPFTEKEVHLMVANGTVTPETLAWREGLSDWSPLSSVITLPGAPPAPTPPPVPPAAAGYEAAALDGPTGVGGWLLFFCITLTILGPVFWVLQMLVQWSTAEIIFDQFPAFKGAMVWETLGSAVFRVYGFVVGFLIWGGNPNGRQLARTYLVASLAGAFGIEIIALMILSGEGQEVFAATLGAVIKGWLGSIVYFAIWWSYFKISKRVRNTYGAE